MNFYFIPPLSWELYALTMFHLHTIAETIPTDSIYYDAKFCSKQFREYDYKPASSEGKNKKVAYDKIHALVSYLA